jgi:hypothetical protein
VCITNAVSTHPVWDKKMGSHVGYLGPAELLGTVGICKQPILADHNNIKKKLRHHILLKMFLLIFLSNLSLYPNQI